MTQEDKQLLLKDLCARLPYNTRIHISHPSNNAELDDWLTTGTIDNLSFFGSVKPYLRPMSNMTKEEKNEYRTLSDEINVAYGPSDCTYKFKLHHISLGIKSDNPHECIDEIIDMDAIDFLNSHHFDYRNLIEKGLALPAPENMYKID